MYLPSLYWTQDEPHRSSTERTGPQERYKELSVGRGFLPVRDSCRYVILPILTLGPRSDEPKCSRGRKWSTHWNSYGIERFRVNEVDVLPLSLSKRVS